MSLTLSIRNADRLDNGSPTSLVLDRRGAVIGRAPTTDWCLPDPNLHISSRHCEIQFRDGDYQLIDVSTNGTFLLGQSARLEGPHTIAPGDVFVIGSFEVLAVVDGQGASPATAAPAAPAWGGWDATGNAAQAAPATSHASWDSRPTGSAISGTGPLSQSWAAPTAASAPASSGWGAAPAPAPASAAPPSGSSGWGSTAEAAAPASTSNAGWGSAAPVSTDKSAWSSTAQAATPASGWSSAVADGAPPPAADDIWGKIAASNVVDWARGGFGSPPPPPPLGIAPAAPEFAPLPSPSPVGSAPAFADAPTSSAAPAAPPPSPATGGGAATFLGAAGLTGDQLKQPVDAAMAQAGDIMRRVIAGMVVMLEARARAKSQLGAAGTSLEFDGNNPLKFARTPEQALAQLLNPTERGFMPADRAIEDAFRDLQAHQVATLKAMQGALRATLDRFSPTAIRARVEDKGLMQKVMPGARDAALWKAYEREFSGVAQGSDEAFMDVFAKEFRTAYEEQARKK